MNKFKNKFGKLDENNLERKRNTREEKNVKEDLPKIVFSFKDFDVTQIPPGNQARIGKKKSCWPIRSKNLEKYVNAT